MDFLEKAIRVQPDVVRFRRDLHQMPEVGNDLPKTSAYVQSRLLDYGVPFTTMINGNGVVAEILGAAHGKTVALRADMDALPLREEAAIDFASKTENMHACGHDAHVAMLLGAAKVLHDCRDKIKGKVRLIFQPGEEGYHGAALMIEEGVLKGVDAIFGLHTGSLIHESKESGKIICHKGACMAGNDKISCKIIGRGGHGAAPEECIDPIAIAAQVISGIYTYRARRIAGLDPVVISICTIHGGTAVNIVPQTCEFTATLRYLNPKTRAKTPKDLENLVRSICAAHGADCEFTLTKGYEITINHPEAVEMVYDAAASLGLGGDIMRDTKPLMGSEDFSYFLKEVPGAFFFLTSVHEQQGKVYPHHHAKFMLDESMFSTGVAMLAKIAWDYLT